MKRIFSTLCLALLSLTALADEGMWLPSLISSRIDDMRAKGFQLTAEDIYVDSIDVQRHQRQPGDPVARQQRAAAGKPNAR